MPTTTYQVRTIGNAWARCVADWEAYVVDLTATFAISMTNAAPLRAMKTDTTIGGVTQTNIYYISEIEPFTGMAVTTYLQAQGMRTMPRTLQPLYGARNTLNEWRNVMVPFRRTTMCGAMGITAKSLRQDSQDCSPINYDGYIDYWAVVKNGLFGMDSTLLQLYQADWTWVLTGDAPLSDGLCGGAQGQIIDVSGIVESVDQIAFNDVDVSFNNGGVIYSVRGKANGG